MPRFMPHPLRTSALAGCLLAGALATTPAQAATGTNTGTLELLVKRRSTPTVLRDAANDSPRIAPGSFPQLGWERTSLRPDSNFDSGLAALLRDPEILAVETNIEVTALQLPAATMAAKANGILNAAEEKPAGDDPFRARQWALEQIRTPDAWRITNGSPEVIVAVIDTGINYLHEDLATNMWRNPGEIPGNGIDDDGNGWIDDLHGIDVASDAHGGDCDPFDEGVSGHFHGTMVAGIIGAAGQNSHGIAGISPVVRIMAVRAIRTSNRLALADELAALDYVLAMKRRGVNIRAVNLSYGGLPFSAAEREALAALLDADIAVIAAAGNSGQDNDRRSFYPASHTLPGMISVAATDSADRLAVFPQTYGSSHYGRRTVSLAAPGLGIFTTSGPHTADYEPAFWGTSAATPHVVGAAALLAAVNPAATPVDIKQALIESVDVVPALTNRLVSHGRLNIARAIDHPRIATGPPRLLRAPESQLLLAGEPLSLSGRTAGQHPRLLQWLHSGMPIPGATNEQLTFARTTHAHAGGYQLIVSNPLAVVTSAVASITFTPLVLARPAAQRTAHAGSTLRLAPGLRGPKPFRHQWLFNSEPIPHATNATLKISRLSTAHEGHYSLVAENEFGEVTALVTTLAVIEKPAIALAPVTQTVVQGGSATWSVSFTGHPGPFEVRWQRGTVIRARENLLNVGTAYFTLTNIQPADAGSWRVAIRHAASPSDARSTFKLVVLPDADGDGFPDNLAPLPSPWTSLLGHSLDADSDNDGMSNRDELAAGTHPTDPQSRLVIEAITRSPDGQVTIRFPAVSNRTYTVLFHPLSTSDAVSSWERLFDIPATRTNRQLRFTLPMPGQQEAGLLRLVTPRQP